MNPIEQFERERTDRIAAYKEDNQLGSLSRSWLIETMAKKYVYNFTWLGRPIIQYPQDMVAVQEILWEVKPDVVIETGIAHGGSLILSASMLALIDYCEAIERGTALDPKAERRRVIGVDIDIREHNRKAIENHPLASKIEMIQGSSIDPATVEEVRSRITPSERVLIFLDSNHVHDHVLAELEAYAPLTSVGSYCVVFDTFVEDMPDDLFPDRAWCKGDNPKTAVHEYLRLLKSEGRAALDGKSLKFEFDHTLENKLQVTVAPDGYLKRSA